MIGIINDFMAVGHNTSDPLNPFGMSKERGRRIRLHPDKLEICVRDDARENLGSFLFESLGGLKNPQLKYSDIELDSMSWLESNKGKVFKLAAGSISDWHDSRYYITMPVKGVKGSITVEEIASATGGLLLPIGFCDLVHDPYN